MDLMALGKVVRACDCEFSEEEPGLLCSVPLK